MTQTIALVDDDRNILTSISIALEKEGYSTTYLMEKGFNWFNKNSSRPSNNRY